MKTSRDCSLYLGCSRQNRQSKETERALDMEAFRMYGKITTLP